ncbi:hypothetical protein [Variovorax sp. UC74_104]
MSAYARNFLRLRSWFDGLDGAELRSFTPYEQRLFISLCVQAQHLLDMS